MLPFQPRTIQTFSPGPDPAEKPSRRQGVAPARPGRPRYRARVPGRLQAGDGPAPGTMRRGDAVVFARLDLAETLGIWRHAQGRVVGIHRQVGAAPTVDVKFEGHDTLACYLPDLFRRVQ